MEVAELASGGGAPSGAGSTLQTGGTLGLDALYIQRREDDRVLALLREHAYCSILTTRQMGKSSLMTRLRARLEAEGTRTVAIDLAGDIGTPRDSNEFYLGILDHVVASLKLDVEVTDWWEAASGQTANQRLVAFFRTVAMAGAAGPVVVFLDEIDATLKLPFSDDLFTAIRTLFNGRPDHPGTRRLAFCLLGTATPSELIKDRRTTPYNIGHTIELADFDPARDDLSRLEAKLAGAGRDGARTLAEVLAWTGGHPFLTIMLCSRALESPPAVGVDALVRAAIGASVAEELKVHFEWINRFMAERLQHGSATFRLYADLLAQRRVPPQIDAYAELRLSGLVKTGPQGYLIVRNRIYRERFDEAWLQRARPPRVSRAIRRSFAGLGAIIALFGAVLVVQHQRAAAARRDVLRKVEGDLVSLYEAVADRDADRRRDETIGLIASLPDDLQPGLLDRVAQQYRAYWARKAAPYDIASKTELSHPGGADQALILAAAAAAKAGRPSVVTGAGAPLEETEFQQHLIATLRLANDPIHVRAISDSVVVAIGAADLLVVWKIDNLARPAVINLKSPVALAAAGGVLAVAERERIELWGTASIAGAAFDATQLQHLAVLPAACRSPARACRGGGESAGPVRVTAIALEREDAGRLRLATGCDNGYAVVESVDLTTEVGAPWRCTYLRGEANRPATVSALAFGPGGHALAIGSALLWGASWDFAGDKPPVRFESEPAARGGSRFARALDLRVAAERVTVSGPRVGDSASPRAAVYRRAGGSWARQASIEEHGIVASDLSSDGARVATVVQDPAGGGAIIIWDPQTGREVMRLPTVLAKPVDVVWISRDVLVVAMSDLTLRVLSLAPIARPAKDGYGAWQVRLGLAVDDGSTIPRALWPLGDATAGFAVIRGPKD